MPRGGQRLRNESGLVNGLGRRVRERRKLLGLTQPQFCARIEMASDGGWLIDRQDVLRIESGGRIVGDLEILCLAQVLEVSACWLLLGEAPDL